MASRVWPQVNKLADGDSLDASTLNKPIGQLAERTQFLLSKVELSGGDGASLVVRGVALESSGGIEPQVGNVVYLDSGEGAFAAAMAEMSMYDDFKASNSALAVGILVSKSGSTGDVLVYGRLGFDVLMVTVSSMIESGEKFRPGRYYLSSRERGRLTADPSGPMVYVCSIYGGGDGSYGYFTPSSFAMVNPQFLDIGTSHVHRTAVLVARPAGDVDENGSVVGYHPSGWTSGDAPSLLFGGTWTSSSFDIVYNFSLAQSDALQTRLCWTEGPADVSASGNSMSVNIVPNGGYVEVSNGLLARLLVPAGYSGELNNMAWDALSFPEAAMGWVDHVPYPSQEQDENRGARYDYNIGMDQQVSNNWPPVPPKSAAIVVNGVEMNNKALFPGMPTVSFGANTICWFCGNEGKRPWPAGVAGRFDSVPIESEKSMVMHWVRSFQGATGPVTSIQAKEGSPLKVYRYGSNSNANVGDLEIAADFDFAVEDGGISGFNVAKTGRGGKLLAGPVVEKISAGPGIRVVTAKGCPVGQGTLSIGLDDNTYRSQFGDIALENAEQAKIGMFPYIRFKGYSSAPISPSSFTATMRVPTNLPDGSYALVVQAAVFGEASFEDVSQRVAGFELDYNILPDYTEDAYNNLRDGLLKPDSSRKVLIEFGHENNGDYEYSAFDPMVVTTDGSDLDPEAGVVSTAFGNVIPYAEEFAGQGISPVLRPGYLVGIRFSRVEPTLQIGQVQYTGAVGFINLIWNLVMV